MQRVRVDSGPWVVIPLGSSTWSVRLTGVSEGPHTLTWKATDIATNFYEATLQFSVDITPPTLTAVVAAGSVRADQPAVFDIRGTWSHRWTWHSTASQSARTAAGTSSTTLHAWRTA